MKTTLPRMAFINNCQKVLVSSFRVENFKQILFLKILLKDGSSRQKRLEKIKFLHELFKGFFQKLGFYFLFHITFWHVSSSKVEHAQ